MPATKLGRYLAPQTATPSEAAPTRRATWTRRDFLKVVGIGAGGFAAGPWRACAGSFTRADFDSLVPADKKLTPEWLESLTARGERSVYTGKDLDKIGMPIGGICAGQVYLGGDGRLWQWDIFNHAFSTGAEHYAKPLEPSSPFQQGFSLRITSENGANARNLSAAHWPKTTFVGEYPIGYIEYADPASPAVINLEAFSPFVPLDTRDSSLPVTILEFTVKNGGTERIEVELSAWLENPVCLYSSKARDGIRSNRIIRQNGMLLLDCGAEEAPAPQPSARPDIPFEDFEKATYGNWTATGEAFGSGPAEISKIPDYQGDVGGKGLRVVNSHASAPGGSVQEKDAATGVLTSPAFKIARDYISFLVGGGGHQGKTCMNLLVDEEVVLSATGQDNNHMAPRSWDVRRWAGKSARLQIVDDATSSWGNIGVDNIVFTDQPEPSPGLLREEEDFGTMALGLLDPKSDDSGIPQSGSPPSELSSTTPDGNVARARFGEKLTGALTRKMSLEPGESQKAAFIIAWHFPNLKLQRLPQGRYYAWRFDSAQAVARFVAENYSRLTSESRLWHDTWYDSTLPHWFLERTFANTSTLATSTCYRLGNGRFYGWEGVGCCAGTCAHVWHYAHAVARLFPELERITRENVDFGLALQPDGSIHFRGEFNDFPAVDGQAGAILRALREHQMCSDDAFLKRNWAGIKRATGWLLNMDGDGNGIIEGSQHNTLDANWYGPVAWLSGLYQAALRAAHKMALVVGDQAFAERCRRVFEPGEKNIVRDLFSGEYFVNKPDPKHPEAINSGTGCEIDQVFGQSWAFQVGLPRVFPESQTRSALKALWRYNFTPDVGPYRKVYRPGRWYAMPGEAGLLMCTFPRTDWDYAQAKGKGAEWAAGYFDECMAGFEYQVAGHMIWEGLVTEGLAVARAIHDRYHPSRRNPWNEVECGDHYARSMASYGVFLAACGYEYDGPVGHIGFAPRLTPHNFKCPFTSAEGWGSYSQAINAGQFNAKIDLKWGKLRFRSLALELPAGADPASFKASLNGAALQTRQSRDQNRLLVTLADPVDINAGESLDVSFNV